MTDACPYRHDVYLCPDCRVICTTDFALRMHLNGKKHSRRIRAQTCPHPSHCKLCNVSLASGWDYPQHIRGRNHRTLLQEQLDSGRVISNDDDDDDPSSTPPGHVHCEICNTRILSHMWTRHLTGLGHRKKERYVTIQAAFEEADKDKHGVKLRPYHDLKPELDFGFIELDSLHRNSVKELEVIVELTTEDRIIIEDIRLSSTKSTAVRPSG